ncbi:MAG: peptidoglycan editing factor PgeF [Desulfobacterales bacterium]
MSFLQFYNLSRFPKIRHGIFTRKGGYSPRPFHSLNTSYTVGDNPANVRKNRGLIADCFVNGQNKASMIYLKQVHSDRIRVLTGKPEQELSNRPDLHLEGDAVVTNLSGRYLVIQVADCQSVLFYDPVKHVAANVHSGWRGSVQNIIGKTVCLMKQQFMSNPEDIVAGIGPSLGPCCAEFVNYRFEIPENFRKYKTGRHFFDFWAISRKQMTSEGIREENIETAEMCTRCRKDLFFSYRGEQVTGRFSGVIGILQ